MKTVQKILVPVDFSEQSAKGLNYSASLGREMKAELIVLHVFDKNERYLFLDALAAFEGWPSPSHSLARIPIDVWFREKALDLHRFIEKVIPEPAGLKIKRQLRTGKFGKEILAVAREEKVDLIVLESKKKSLFSYLTARAKLLTLIWKLPCPVLVTPPDSTDWREPRGPLMLPPIPKQL